MVAVNKTNLVDILTLITSLNPYYFVLKERLNSINCHLNVGILHQTIRIRKVFINMKAITKNRVSKENQMRIKTMSEFLKEYRIQSGLTQEMLSEYAELNRSSVIRVESGQPVTLMTILKICSVLELPLYELFFQENQ